MYELLKRKNVLYSLSLPHLPPPRFQSSRSHSCCHYCWCLIPGSDSILLSSFCRIFNWIFSFSFTVLVGYLPRFLCGLQWRWHIPSLNSSLSPSSLSAARTACCCRWFHILVTFFFYLCGSCSYPAYFLVFKQLNKKAHWGLPSMFNILNIACFLDIRNIYLSWLQTRV